MSYSVAEDIQKDFPGVTFDSSSKVKLDDLDDFIVDADALIDSYLSTRYVTPVTGTESLKVLRLYSRSLVSDKVTGILQIKQQTNTGANQNVRSGLSTKDVIKLLEALAAGESQLPDADLLLDDAGISSFNAKNCVKPEFKKSERNW